MVPLTLGKGRESEGYLEAWEEEPMTLITKRGQVNRVASGSPRSSRADAAALGLLSTRVSIAIRRSLQGDPLTGEDISVLGEISRWLLDEAAAVQFVASAGERGHEPSRTAAAGLAVSALGAGVDRLDDEVLAQGLADLAHKVSSFSVASDSGSGHQLLTIFEGLSAVARAEAGSSGERLVGRD